MKDTATCTILLSRAKNQQDEEAWEELCEKYEMYIFTLSRKLGLDTESAKDLTQNVLVKLWQKLPLFDYDPARAKFRTWLCKIIKNSVSSKLRSKRKLVDLCAESIDQEAEENIHKGLSEEWEKDLLKIAMLRIRNEFSGKAIQAFRLHYDGHEVSQIASLLNIRNDSVYQLKNRVYKRLKKEIRFLEESF